MASKGVAGSPRQGCELLHGERINAGSAPEAGAPHPRVQRLLPAAQQAKYQFLHPSCFAPAA